MKKTIILCFAILGLCFCSMAHPVDQETAKVVASKFMRSVDIQLVTTYSTDNGDAAFYIFNTSDGFVIVAADDSETPIIQLASLGSDVSFHLFSDVEELHALFDHRHALLSGIGGHTSGLAEFLQFLYLKHSEHPLSVSV